MTARQQAPLGGSALALLMMLCILKRIKPDTNCLFNIESKDKYLGTFSVVLSNIVFIRLELMSVVNFGYTLCSSCLTFF